jgi:hypothetical protein
VRPMPAIGQPRRSFATFGMSRSSSRFGSARSWLSTSPASSCSAPAWTTWLPGGSEARSVTRWIPTDGQSVEGPVVAIEPADLERDRRPLAHRYFGARRGDRYIEKTRGEPGHVENVLVRMLPERWLTMDYAKASGSL